jgi:nitroreductase
MDKFIDIVKARRSIRSYRADPVPREMIEVCIDAARYAPTASNTQNWHFYIDEDELKDRIVAECLGGIVPNRFAATAPVIVAVAMKLTVVTHRLGSRLTGIRYHELDAGIAGEHFVLQATEFGLGTCWIGWFDKRAVRRLLRIPAGWDVPALLTLGFPDECPREKARKPVKDICTFRRKR